MTAPPGWREVHFQGIQTETMLSAQSFKTLDGAILVIISLEANGGPPDHLELHATISRSPAMGGPKATEDDRAQARAAFFPKGVDHEHDGITPGQGHIRHFWATYEKP